MKTYNYDAFGNLGHVESTASGGPQAIVVATAYLCCGDVYDPMLTPSYLLPRHRDPILGRFTNFDNNEGEIAAPASLQKFRYAGQTAIHAADPGETFTSAEQGMCQGV